VPETDAFNSLAAVIDYPMLIVTAFNGEERAGCLVGFATQASIEPIRMMVMISKKNHTYRVVTTADELVVHFLGSDDFELAKLFGEETGEQVDKFSRCRWTATPSGSPVLDGTLGWVECSVLSRVDAGDHVGHLVEPVRGGFAGGSGQLGFQAVRSLNPGHRA
jgi:flavin reductase (DIM6/NTAB) family NADH-FMN oxidoreductase RutF